MEGKLFQVFGDGIEELYLVHDGFSEETFRKWWKEYEEGEYDNFEHYLESHAKEDIERVFVEEIYV